MTPDQKKRIRSKLFVVNEYGCEHQDPEATLDQEEVDLLVERYGIRTDVHKTCINCQGRQVMKYEQMRNAKTGKSEDKFRVRCNYIPNKLPDGSRKALEDLVANGMDEDRALLMLKSSVDPVAWARLMFGFQPPSEEELRLEKMVQQADEERIKRETLWYLRPYQREQLRCSSERLVIREGRRCGKTFSMALKLLYLIFNREEKRGRDANGNAVIRGPSIMVVTPYQSQIRNIFDELENLLKRNVDLKEACVTGGGGGLYVKTPFFRMEFSNGGRISGFVSGVGSKTDGSGGGVIRGQTASIIYLDEMDMIPDEILDKAVLPILISYPDTMLLATSTPIGKKGRFYKWAKEDPTWKEDYLPSSVLPQWDAQKEMLENENSEESFRAEYLAEFVDGGFGVFKANLVYAARQDYTYEQTQDPNWWKSFCNVRDQKSLIICIGIDWNKNAGTEFVVTAYDPLSGRFIVVEAVNIPASQFSALKWKQEVIRLNYKWRPMYIYADEGYGHTIIEDLKYHAFELNKKENKNYQDMQTVKLYDRLTAFNFSSKVELRNPVDNTKMTKTGKDFLVHNSVRIFEDEKIWYGESDESMRKQLLNYVVLRVSNSGKQIFGGESHSVGDHRLDALMLSLGGLALELGVYSSNSMPTSGVEMMTKDQLDLRKSGPDRGEASATIERLEKAGGIAGGGALTFLQSQGRNVSEQSPVMGRRSRGGLPGASTSKSVYNHFNERAKSSAGYANDTEHLHQRESMHVVGRRQKPSTRRNRKSIRKRRK